VEWRRDEVPRWRCRATLRPRSESEMRKSRVNKEMVKSEKLLSDLFVSGFQARYQGRI
jgi:hypothetical protein